MKQKRCSGCGHQAHGNVCFNMASDNGCECKVNALAVTSESNPKDRIALAREFAEKFYETNRSLKFETELQLMADYADHRTKTLTDRIAVLEKELQARRDEFRQFARHHNEKCSCGGLM